MSLLAAFFVVNTELLVEEEKCTVDFVNSCITRDMWNCDHCIYVCWGGEGQQGCSSKCVPKCELHCILMTV